MIKDIQHQIQRAMGQIRLAFRGVLGAVNSNKGVQTTAAKGLAGEDLRDMEVFQHYGFTSRPHAGTEAVIIPLGGKTSHGIVIATENHQYRLTSLATGEVALYTDEGAKIVLKRGRVIEVDCDVMSINCKTFTVNATQGSDFTTPLLTTSQAFTSEGVITGNGGLAISGGNGAHVTGGLHTTEDVVAATVSLQNHRHQGDSGGITGSPL